MLSFQNSRGTALASAYSVLIAYSRPVIKRLVDHILGGEGDNASSALINGIAILVELIRKGTTYIVGNL